MKICLRLAVSLTPVALKGPRTSNDVTRSTRSWPPPGAYMLQPILGLGKAAVLERHGEVMDARRRLEADVLQPLVDGFDRRILLLVDGLHVLFAADAGLVDLLAVEHDDQLVLELHVVDPEGLRHVGDVERVLAVGREVVVHHNAAARAERQAVLVDALGAGLLMRDKWCRRAGRPWIAHGLHDHVCAPRKGTGRGRTA